MDRNLYEEDNVDEREREDGTIKITSDEGSVNNDVSDVANYIDGSKRERDDVEESVSKAVNAVSNGFCGLWYKRR